MAAVLTSNNVPAVQLTPADIDIIDASFSSDPRRTFLYHYDVSVDRNGIFKLPPKWVNSDPELNTYIVIPAPDGPVRCIPAHQFADRDFILNQLSCTELARLDDRNRLQISQRLLQYAGVTNCAFLSGVFDSFEIWNPVRAEAYFAKAEAEFIQNLGGRDI